MGVKKVVAERLEGVKADYANDLAALTHEQLGTAAARGARVPYDWTYEVVVVNDRMSNAMKGISNGPWPFEGWAVAPEDFRNPERAISEISRSLDGIIESWNALGEEEISREITSPGGATSTPLDFALMCVQHTAYHDAQLNFVQAMGGDMEVHWK